MIEEDFLDISRAVVKELEIDEIAVEKNTVDALFDLSCVLHAFFGGDLEQIRAWLVFQ